MSEERRGVLARQFVTKNIVRAQNDSNRILMKSLIIFMIILFIAFLVYSTVWYIRVENKYEQYLVNMNDKEYSINIDEYSLSVKKPTFLTYKGNLIIHNTETDDKLIIWPIMSGGYEYSYLFTDDGVKYQIFINEDLKALDTSWGEAVKKVEVHQKQLEVAYNIANNYWNLD